MYLRVYLQLFMYLQLGCPTGSRRCRVRLPSAACFLCRARFPLGSLYLHMTASARMTDPPAGCSSIPQAVCSVFFGCQTNKRTKRSHTADRLNAGCILAGWGSSVWVRVHTAAF